MTFNYFSRNGQVLPIGQAVIPLANLEYSYGFGAYETIRVNNRVTEFEGQHLRRLLESASIIELDHEFSIDFIGEAIEQLIKVNQMYNGSLKILLIGGQTKAEATLNILSLSPLYPNRKLYKTGAHVITAEHEREFPHAKTLNMLPSYLLYRQARAAGAYDTLLLNREGCLNEGTRTNFLALRGRVIFSPPAKDILLGVTRDNVLKVARQNGFMIKEKPIKLSEIKDYDITFLTGTTCKILPIRSIDNNEWSSLPTALEDLIQAFAQYLVKAPRKPF